jgi:hypothetical protein
VFLWALLQGQFHPYSKNKIPFALLSPLPTSNHLFIFHTCEPSGGRFWGSLPSTFKIFCPWKNQVQKNLDLHFAINISGNSPFGTPALTKNVEPRWIHCTFDRNKKFSSASKVVQLVFAQRFVTIFNCRYHNSNHLNVCHKHTPLSPINCQSVDNCCIITMTQFTCKGVKQINNQISLNMTFTFTICISRRFSSAREFQMGNFQKYWSQNVGPDFFVLDFFHGQKILKDV